MTKKLKFSVMKYIPNILNGECINIGILFSDDIKFKTFYYTNNMKRIKYFNEEISTNRIKNVLVSIEKDVTNANPTIFNIEKYIKFYNNSLCFEKTSMVEYEDLDDTIDKLKKLYLKYDYNKKERESIY